jgi:uncharacterized protein YqgV (UPF0045/DUF77 family)
MTDYNINAAIQLLPIGTAQHPYWWVDQVIKLIAQSGLAYQVTPFNTSVEGSYEAVKALIDNINQYLRAHQCEEWLLSVQYQFKSGAHVVASHKTAPYGR